MLVFIFASTVPDETGASNACTSVSGSINVTPLIASNFSRSPACTVAEKPFSTVSYANFSVKLMFFTCISFFIAVCCVFTFFFTAVASAEVNVFPANSLIPCSSATGFSDK